MPNVDLGFGRTKEIKLNLKLFKDVQAWMFSGSSMSLWHLRKSYFGDNRSRIIANLIHV